MASPTFWVSDVSKWKGNPVIIGHGARRVTLVGQYVFHIWELKFASRNVLWTFCKVESTDGSAELLRCASCEERLQPSVDVPDHHVFLPCQLICLHAVNSLCPFQPCPHLLSGQISNQLTLRSLDSFLAQLVVSERWVSTQLINLPLMLNFQLSSEPTASH